MHIHTHIYKMTMLSVIKLYSLLNELSYIEKMDLVFIITFMDSMFKKHIRVKYEKNGQKLIGIKNNVFI